MPKGSKYERQICKQLSRWWSGGERDDIFWRVSQSGGRATQRMKKGQRTYGSYGDVAAIDPIGEPLLKQFTIELKRGRSHGSPGDLLDCPPRTCQQPFEKTLTQTIRSHEHAGSDGWMLIGRRDARVSIACVDLPSLRSFGGTCTSLFSAPCARFRWPVNLGGKRVVVTFAVFPLEVLLQRLSPALIRARVRS